MQEMTFHEAAALFELLTGEEYEGLVEDIREHGLRETIKLFEGKILDGRNRYRACLQAGIEPRFEAIETDNPRNYVVSLNLHRRHLDKSQLAMIGARIRPDYDRKAKERMTAGGGDKKSYAAKSGAEQVPHPIEEGRARDLAAAAVGVSGPLVDHATKVLAKGDPLLIAAVDQGRMNVKKAAGLTSQPVETQRALATAAGHKNNGVSAGKSPKAAPRKKTFTLAGKTLKGATLTDKAVAMRADIGRGFSKMEVCTHYGIGDMPYKRLAQVVNRNHAGLIAAMNSRLLEPGAAPGLLKKTDAEIDAAIERAGRGRHAREHADAAWKLQLCRASRNSSIARTWNGTA